MSAEDSLDGSLKVVSNWISEQEDRARLHAEALLGQVDRLYTEGAISQAEYEYLIYDVHCALSDQAFGLAEHVAHPELDDL